MSPASLIATSLLAATACSTALPPASPVPAGTYLETVTGPRAGLFRRTALVHVPAQVAEKTATRPLVVALHGAFSGAAAMERESGFSRLADREGFIVAYPNGYGFLGIARHWNSGHCCGPARAGGTDDVAFLDRVIDHVSERLAVDPERIYVVGFSNGGMLAHRYAAERSDRVAAVAVVAGAIGGRPDTGEPEWRIPTPARPVPLMILHGTGDDRVPYEGTPLAQTEGRSWLPVTEAVSFWRTHNAAVETFGHDEKGGITRTQWRGGAPVMLLRLDHLGHVWPGRGANLAAPGFDAADAIWDFFSSVPARAEPSLVREAALPDGLTKR